MAVLIVLDVLINILGLATILYQVVCVVVGLLNRPVELPEGPPHRFAVLIAARNESAVIGELLDSLAAQTYPHELMDVFVIADNCTDDTAEVVRRHGAHAYERFDKTLIGKGYALSYLFDQMRADGIAERYDAFFVIDADNLLEPDYIREMNKVYSSGFKIVTSYRNSRNFSTNWLSSGSALWFVRESRLLNNSRMALGTSCHVGGTGFMFDRSIMERNDGWKHHLLTEDLEFTMDSVLHGNRIGYCGTAVLYDEQPVTFSQSWRQRLRWSRGFLQVFRYYGPALLRRAIDERDFSCIDLTLLIFPFAALGALRGALGFVYVAAGFVSLESQIEAMTQGLVLAGAGTIGLMLIAMVTVISERDRIGASNRELFAYCITFPLYMASYIPISFAAIFSKAQWKPIHHAGDSSSVGGVVPGASEPGANGTTA